MCYQAASAVGHCPARTRTPQQRWSHMLFISTRDVPLLVHMGISLQRIKSKPDVQYVRSGSG